MAGILKILLSLVLIATLFGCADEEADMGDSDASSAKQISDRDKEPNRRQSKTEKDALKRKFSTRPVPVSTAAVERGRLDAYYSSTATLTAVEEAVVVARTQGIVEAIFVEEGILVKKGQALAQLDTRRLSLEVNRTQTNLESLQRAFDRAEQLFKRNMISPDAHDQARFNLEREQATLALQLHDLEEATIRAPIDGVITQRHIKLGNTLTPNTAAFELKRADIVEAVLNIPERELSKLKANQVAKVRIDALERAEFIGYIDRGSPHTSGCVPSSSPHRPVMHEDRPHRSRTLRRGPPIPPVPWWPHVCRENSPPREPTGTTSCQWTLVTVADRLGQAHGVHGVF